MDFENEYVKCQVNVFKNSEFIQIIGNVKNKENYKNIFLLACNPIDKKASYSGSGLPFPCPDIAFENTKNIYNVPSSGSIDTKFSYPNSYYSVADKKKIISSIFFIVELLNGEKKFLRFELEDLYPLKTLINREARQGPEFYSKKYELLPIDTAENIMSVYAHLKITENIA